MSETDVVGDTPVPSTVLIVSDLHLVFGRDPSTGRYRENENFFSGGAFARAFQTLQPAGSDQSLLVLNGDIFDFLRITGYPGEPPELEHWADLLARLGRSFTVAQLQNSINAKERKYGLRTDDYKSVWKLRQIEAGHGDFFDALASWLRVGGRLLILKGNHDLEFYWPLVQQAVRLFLVDHGASSLAATEQVTFADDYVQIANLYIEHGHQYDTECRVLGGPTLRGHGGPPAELRYPLGSFVNRYIINTLEGLEPFFANTAPTSGVLWSLLRRHPLAVFRTLWGAWPLVNKAARAARLRDGFGIELFIASLLVPIVTIAALIGFVMWAVTVRHESWSTVASRWSISWSVLAAVALGFPYLVGLVRDLLPTRRPVADGHAFEDVFACGAYTGLKSRNRCHGAHTLYAVLGHTHVQDVQALPAIDGMPTLYLNSGTWTPLWPADRPDMAGHILHPVLKFIRGVDGMFRHRYAEWHDDAGAFRDPMIIALND
ncbi:MAG: hypothetical protein ACLPWG_22965 [Steroidobacteraceae bacterium]